ncbi:Trypsin [Caballeronia cordobensis]|uniref:Trypsin n=1 Tax=Caballeronia cordobensis TaxID=1353886 RepID=A0A158GP00_CABCO|nr:trypsin-like serine protease [Caballeronia cordobensis]SAL33339.1 Trypsin [Caballeronia cordobensis]
MIAKIVVVVAVQFSLLSIGICIPLYGFAQDYTRLIYEAQARVMLEERAKEANTKVWLRTTENHNPAFQGIMQEYLGKQPTARVSVRADQDTLDKSIHYRAYLLSVARAVDPRTITAVAPELEPSTLEAMARSPAPVDPVLVERLRKSLPLGIVELLSNLQVKLYMPGSGTDAEPPATYPGGQPSFLPTKQGTIDAIVYRRGFPEVAIIADVDIIHCTATHLGQGWLITAAHCVGHYLSADQGDRFELESKLSLSVIFPDELGSDCLSESFDKDIAAPRQCTFRKHKLVSMPAVSDVYHDSSRGDVALLRIDPASTENRSTALVSFGPPPPDRSVTVAGFGRRSSNEPPWKLTVGFQQLNITNDPTEVTTTNKMPTSPCSGDSGGPMFRGTQLGLKNEQHLIFAITSESALSDRSKCNATTDAYYPRLADEPVKKWFCLKLTDVVAACKPP